MWAKSSWCLDQRRRTRAEAGRPSGPREERHRGPRCAGLQTLHISSSVIMLCPLSPEGLHPDSLSPALFCLLRQGCPLPPFLPSEEVGK